MVARKIIPVGFVQKNRCNPNIINTNIAIENFHCIMDPLSVTASIVTLLAASGSIVGGLEKLSSLREAPDIILALNNEISDFRLVIYELTNYLQQDPAGSPSRAQAFSTQILPILDRARSKLTELESIIEYRLVLPGSNGSIRLNKTAWFWERQKVKRIQEEIRSTRTNLVAVIGVLISKSTLRLELQVSELRSSNNDFHGRQSQDLATAVNTSSTTERLLGQLLQIVSQNQTRTESSLHGTFTSLTSQIARLSDSQWIPSRNDLNSGERALGNRTLFISSTIQRSCFACTKSCRCRCHRTATWASPYFLSSVLGRLFTGYTGLPILAQACDEAGCQRSFAPFMSLQYCFPRWFAWRMLQIHLHLPYHGGIEQSLRVSRVVWNGSEIFIKTLVGDVEGVKTLLTTRQHSPFDVDETLNYTTLAVSKRRRKSRLDVRLITSPIDCCSKWPC